MCSRFKVEGWAAAQNIYRGGPNFQFRPKGNAKKRHRGCTESGHGSFHYIMVVRRAVRT